MNVTYSNLKSHKENQYIIINQTLKDKYIKWRLVRYVADIIYRKTSVYNVTFLEIDYCVRDNRILLAMQT